MSYTNRLHILICQLNFIKAEQILRLVSSLSHFSGISFISSRGMALLSVLVIRRFPKQRKAGFVQSTF